MKIKKSKSSSVRFDQVTKVFGKKTVAVDRLSTVFEEGKLITLLGPSGCGKTTVLRMIAGLEMPTSGKIFLGDEEITRLPASDRDISMVFQSYALFPHMDVMKNVSYGLKFSGYSSSEVRERAQAGLKLVGLEHLADRLPTQLSGGQQQRVAVARALVLEPEVLLFDEPLSNLDAKLRRSVREEIREIQQKLGLTVVYVTHDQEEALAVSDRIIVMQSARLAQEGSPREIYQNPVNGFVADFIGEANLFEVEILSLKGKDGLAEIRLGKNIFRVKSGGYRSGAAKVAIRPPHLHVLSGGKKGGVKTKHVNTFPAKLVKATYLGIRMEYTFETDFGSLFLISPEIDDTLRIGAKVELCFAPEHAILVGEG